MVRVIAGTAGGLTLMVPKGDRTRPTADRIKESVFGILGGEVVGRRALDLFAGSGALGIEALSRGAEFGCFVERDVRTVALLRENLERTHLSGRAAVLPADALSALKGPCATQFDLVFADPPYRRGFIAKLAAALRNSSWLLDDALLVIEHHILEEIPPAPTKPDNAPGDGQTHFRAGDLRAVRRMTYGETAVTFARWTSRR